MRALTSIALVVLSCMQLIACSTQSNQIPVPSSGVHTSTDFEVKADIVYTPSNWPRQLMGDLYLPAGMRPNPAVVTVHGGGWDARDRSDMAPVARKLAARGYTVLNIEYRLAPDFVYPAQLDDLREAIRWLRRNATLLGIDPQRIAGWGYSAGGHLVTLAATERADADASLDAVVAGGTPANLPHYPHSPIITRFLGMPYAEDPRRWVDASPVTHVTATAPPMFLYHGTWDRLVDVDDTVGLHHALLTAGVPAELYLIHGAGHIATFLLGFGAEGAGIDFLDSMLRGPAPAVLRADLRR